MRDFKVCTGSKIPKMTIGITGGWWDWRTLSHRGPSHTQFCGLSAGTRVTARTTNMAAKNAMVHRRRFLKIYSLKFCDIWQNFYCYRILVEQANFVTHFIISVQLYYFIWLSKNPSVKIWLNDFQMVIINHSKLYASLQEKLMSKFSVNWAKVKF